MSCIYKIKNKINSKLYIGSTKNLKKRISRHLRDLRQNKHHSIYLQRAYNKYSEDAFEFSIIEETDKLFERELFWIEQLKPEYNLGSVGGGDNITGHPEYESIKKKLLLALEKAWKAEKDVTGSKNPNWRDDSVKRHTTCSCGNTKAYVADTCINCYDKNGEKNPFYGKHHNEETLEKLRQKRLGKKPSNTKKCSIDGIEYESATDAGRQLGISTPTICHRLKSNNIKFKTWFYL